MTDIQQLPENPRAKFSLGKLYFTTRSMRELVAEDLFRAVVRHRSGDWGDLCASDKTMNDEALVSGGRIFSAYHDRKRVKFWIITEYDRSMTTVLLPEEY